MIFSDILYGKIELPDWIEPFIRIPEFLRLRGVRLSNVDSIQFKDFSGPNRWEHSIGVAYLAYLFSRKSKLSIQDSMEIILAALLHDIATPPFAHTVEYVLDNFDHEIEVVNTLNNLQWPVFASEYSRFRQVCEKTSKNYDVNISPERIIDLIIGKSENRYGYLINGSIDFDNADNVTRACLHMGIKVDGSIPIQIVDWLLKLDAPPVELKLIDNLAIQTWLNYRRELYNSFYNSQDVELGRQAFLQHLIRKSLDAGLSRNSLIYNTDERLLMTIENLNPELENLVEKFRFLDITYKIAIINFDSKDNVEVLKSPAAVAWIEKQLTTDDFKPFIIVNMRRFEANDFKNELFDFESGNLQIYKHGDSHVKLKQLPLWLQKCFPEDFPEIKLRNRISLEIEKFLKKWIDEKPWLIFSEKRKDRVKENLESVGNWGFRFSRNENIHLYPSTYVHTIPSTLINALGLNNELILDPFAGTGTTALAAIQNGASAIISDSNSIANLISNTYFTFLTKESIDFLLSIENQEIQNAALSEPPNISNILDWHEKNTLIELQKIKGFINSQENFAVKQFLLTSFSSIITSTTARKGLHLSYFADNTPLAKDQISPLYEPAIDKFLEKVHKNLQIIMRLYSNIERKGLNTKEALQKVNIYKLDSRSISLDTLKLGSNVVDAIITSPPYLCMTDYTFGNRLSYYWIFPDELTFDYRDEIGPRRGRSKPKFAEEQYFKAMEDFIIAAKRVLKPGGYLATVIGEPVSQKFKDSKPISKTYEIWEKHGFKNIWTQTRTISGHRNSYLRLPTERITVHVLD